MFDKLLEGVVIRATKLCNNVALQVARKCCPYYLALSSNGGNGKATKTSLENEHMGNGDYFVIIASSLHPLLLTEHAANGTVEAPLS